MTDRRQMVRGVAACATAALLRPRYARALEPIDASVANAAKLDIGGEVIATVPADFVGLGYEISSPARAGLLSPADRQYVQLVKTLGAHGVVRVGGNTSDDASYSARGEARSAPVGTVVNRRSLEDLGGFLRATGWRLLWGLNLATTNKEAAVEEAIAVRRAVGDHLLGFEIGNEPDLFPGNPKHRPKQYGYDDYLREFRAYRAAILAKAPDAVFAGPDAADRTEWVERFAADEGRSVKLLTHHYYREGQNPTSTLDKLLRPDPKLIPELERLRRVSVTSGVPYRICEVNSFSGGGRPGVSDAFGAALWVLDYMCLLASYGCAGVNVQTGVNQRGFISSYSPIGDDEQGHYHATPEFFGMLAFAAAGGGEMLRVTWDPGTANATAYAFRSSAGEMRAVLINKDGTQSLRVTLPRAAKSVVRLTGPALAARDGILLGGRTVAPDGGFRAGVESVADSGAGGLLLPAASAAVVLLR